MFVGNGRPVIYVDPTGKERAALVTAEHGATSVNVVYVNDDEKQTDSYGLKIERSTSVPHRSRQDAPGNYWREVNE